MYKQSSITPTKTPISINSPLTYRPEIDGLRALAVLAVFIFHLNNSWLQGGFLGVDIFFVISGYLITSIINNKLQTNSFFFKDFYTRRIKRIYPVFILVLFLVSVFGTLFFSELENDLLIKTIESAVVFVSNFYISTRFGYWDMENYENPLLHIWSLAVEEQYYLFFPFFLYACYKVTKYSKTKQNAFFATLGLFIFFVLTTFLPNSIYEQLKIPNTYYLSNLRFPELLVGSLLALGNFKIKEKFKSWVSTISLLGIMACLVWFNKDLPFTPGIMMLIPCSLTALLILSMQGENINQSINQSS